MYICLCNAVTEREIRSCVEDGARSLKDLQRELGVGTCCGRCKPAAKEVLQETRSQAQVVLAGLAG